jgi:hypothetical protein
MTKFIVREYRRDKRLTCYVCARPGWYRSANGEQIRDGSTGGPEHTYNREHALEFKSHRSAALVANLCPGSEVVEFETSSMPPVLH